MKNSSKSLPTTSAVTTLPPICVDGGKHIEITRKSKTEGLGGGPGLLKVVAVHGNVGVNAVAGGLLFHHGNGGKHDGIVRSPKEERKKNAHSAHNALAVHAHCEHTASTLMPPDDSANGRRSTRTRPTNLKLDPDYVQLGEKVFPATKYGCASVFMDSQMDRFFRAMLPQIKAMKLPLPKRLTEDVPSKRRGEITDLMCHMAVGETIFVGQPKNYSGHYVRSVKRRGMTRQFQCETATKNKVKGFTVTRTA